MKTKIIGIFIVTLFLVSAFAGATTIKKIEKVNNDFYSEVKTTTGPLPPEDCGKDIDPTLLSEDRVVIDGVPAYKWRHGCSPTSFGMIIGYWDSHGYDRLVVGDAGYQNTQVNQMIASNENYYDYCLPMDDSNNIKPDKSEPPEGDEHDDNCVADFLYTSQSYKNLCYSATRVSDEDEGIEGYFNLIYPDLIVIAKNKNSYNRISWEEYCEEIDANRPVKLTVDCNGDGVVDHSVTGIGYDNSDENHLYYGCYNTWDTNIHWYEWGKVEDGKSWGVYGATIFHFKNKPNKPEKPLGTEEGKTNEWYNFSTSTVDEDGDRVKFGWNWSGYRSNKELTVDEWTNYYDSGEKCTTSHAWSEEGNYVIRVKAMDTDKIESEWSEPLVVSMPKDKQTSNPLFLQFLENHPHMFPLLRLILDF